MTVFVLHWANCPIYPCFLFRIGKLSLTWTDEVLMRFFFYSCPNRLTLTFTITSGGYIDVGTKYITTRQHTVTGTSASKIVTFLIDKDKPYPSDKDNCFTIANEITKVCWFHVPYIKKIEIHLYNKELCHSAVKFVIAIRFFHDRQLASLKNVRVRGEASRRFA